MLSTSDTMNEEKILPLKEITSSLWKMYPQFEFTGRNTPQRNNILILDFTSWQFVGRQ